MPIRMRLREAASDALSLNQRLENIIAVKSTRPSGVFHGKVDHSQPPWNAAAADAIMDLHAWSRENEQLMRLRTGLPVRERGNSSSNTAKALAAITRLAEKARDEDVTSAAAWLAAWTRKASQILGDTEQAARLPRLQGQKEPPCPWCRGTTLRQLPLAGVVFCIDPSCADDEGRHPKARLEYFRGDFVLRWQDGVVSASWQ